MSYYEVLGIAPGATAEQIRTAYKQRSQETLMDTEAYDEVQAAYETLISDESRIAYDSELRAQSAERTFEASPRTGGTVPLRRAVAATTETGTQDNYTKSLAPVVCPVCSQQNGIGDKYCIECGFLLSGTPGSDFEGSIRDADTTKPRLEGTAGTSFPLRAGLNRVGREKADVLILDKTVSRYHAVVVFDEERHLFSLEDAGSSNGTRVNDFVLPPRSSHPLNDGDEIVFGSVKLKLFAGLRVAPAEKSLTSDVTQELTPIEVTMPMVTTVPTARLTLQRGRGPQEVLLVPGTISIGRLPDNQISLPGDRYASGHHAQLVVEETVYRLIDVGSTNGSYLNGLRLTTNESIAMSDGDELMIGSTVFQFQIIKKNKRPAANTEQPVDTSTESNSAPASDDLPEPKF